MKSGMHYYEIIEDIVDIEWNMFQQVNNEGGRASCQDDPETFRIMRSSQFSILPESLLLAYRKGLLRAQMQERNPVMEKYARMMESTAPEQYRQIAPFLPQVTAERRQMVEEVVEVHKGWMAEHAAQYPKLSDRGRFLYTEQDTPWDTSAETYLRGELLTWSMDALKIYRDFVLQAQAEERNLVIEQDRRMVEQYGFASLEEAEDAQR